MTLQVAVESGGWRISNISDIPRRKTYSPEHRAQGKFPVQRTLAAWHPSQALRSLEGFFSNCLDFRILSFGLIGEVVPSQPTRTEV